MFKNPFYKDVAKALAALVAVLALCRYTLGAMAAVITLVGFGAAATRRGGLAACCYLMFPLIVNFNRAIVGSNGLLLLIARFGCLAMTAVLMLTTVTQSRGYKEKLPIGSLLLYLLVAVLSSAGGWMPFISYMKILNFGMMLVGLSLVARTMQGSDRDLRLMRAFMMALALLMIPGSLLAYFFPSVGYSMTIYKMEAYTGYAMTGEELLASGGQVLFNGMTCHSQMLSPFVSILATWVLMDAIEIERRVTKLHASILACVPVLLYMSRSRGGLLMLVSVVAMTMMLTLPREKLSARAKARINTMVIFGVILMVGAAVYFQAKNEAISRWIRKTDDVAADQRSLKDAFTGSRQLLIEENLADFKRNPLWGKGFQVVQGMDAAYRAGRYTWFSASVEKGVTPYVILGETGALGAIAFMIFLFAFYGACWHRRYLSLMTSFTCFLVANLADSTFFSPSGSGGFMWCIACIGSFATDVMAKRISALSPR